MGNKGGYVYILASARRTVLYIGVTSDLRQRVAEHQAHKYPNSFTAKYHCTNLVYYERFDGIVAAIRREKRLKNWPRARKEGLIRKLNPGLRFYDPVTLQLPDVGKPKRPPGK